MRFKDNSLSCKLEGLIGEKTLRGRKNQENLIRMDKVKKIRRNFAQDASIWAIECPLKSIIIIVKIIVLDPAP